jgi:hypothetical protein
MDDIVEMMIQEADEFEKMIEKGGEQDNESKQENMVKHGFSFDI